jgi:putative transcriptional regulator
MPVKSSLHDAAVEIMLGSWLENRLKELRLAHRLSQGELALRLGVSRQTINAVETDKYDPSLPLAMRMSKLFGVPVDAIFIDRWTPVEGIKS